MKVIFLDIDGVLNGDYMYDLFRNRPTCDGYLGIGKKHVRHLYNIVSNTNAKIVLVSSWKYDYVDYLNNHNNQIGKYLKQKLRKLWNMSIYDTTIIYDRNCGLNRGTQIKSWLANKPDIENWVILDDEIFGDYDEEIMKHLVKTDFMKGLTAEDANKAIEILGGNLNEICNDSDK